MMVMHYLSPQQPENPVPVKRTAENISSVQGMNLEKLIEEDALLEYAQYVENYYGTPRSYVEEQLQAGRNVILEIEIQGAMKIKEKNTGSTSGVCNSADCGGTGTPSHRQRNRNRTGDRRQTCKSW